MIEDENDRDGCFALTIETIEKNGTVAGSSSGANSSAAGILGGVAGSVVAAGPVVAAGAVAVSTEFDCTRENKTFRKILSTFFLFFSSKSAWSCVVVGPIVVVIAAT
jgi:hypothetical protein